MMLKIKRVPTVLSNYQKEDSEVGCGRNCLRSCCLPGVCSFSQFNLVASFSYFVVLLIEVFVVLGAKLPLYAFKKESDALIEKGSVSNEKKEFPVDFLDSLLIGEVKLFS